MAKNNQMHTASSCFVLCVRVSEFTLHLRGTYIPRYCSMNVPLQYKNHNSDRQKAGRHLSYEKLIVVWF